MYWLYFKQVLPNLVFLLYEIGIQYSRWVANGDKNMNSESQNFEVRQANARTIFKEPPARGNF